MKKPLGFTLLELMTFFIFTLIITIALAAFQNYSIRAKFSELVLAAIPHKEAVERAIQIRNPSALTDLDGDLSAYQLMLWSVKRSTVSWWLME